jgi:toxin YoeB
MKLLWSETGWEDYLYWQEADRRILRRINALIGDIDKTPFTGIGKPEPLMHELRGWWSRRIAADHRLVYRVIGQGNEQRVEIIGCRYHYTRRG